jgi:hypothetical protein
MNNNPSHAVHPDRWQRWTPPAIAAGTLGTILVFWFEEAVALAAEFIAVLALPFLAGVIYLFNLYLFKSATPKADDIKK